jgi:prolyl-tRNA synthetase
MREDEVAAFGIVAGYVGPQPARAGLRQIFDTSVTKTPNLVTGGNKDSLHKTGFNFTRDLADAANAEVHDISEAREGDPCPSCGKGLTVTRGIEVGNIFQLGTKYTEAMSFTYTEEDGTKKAPLMGCYGIGIGRTLACVIEEHHDERGPLWPISVAPFEVAICCLQAKKPGVVDAARDLYKKLKEAKIEVILDDREVSAGFLFADADLIGAPVRLIVSPRNMDKKVVEMKYRLPATRGFADLPLELPLGDVDAVVALIKKLRAELAG